MTIGESILDKIDKCVQNELEQRFYESVIGINQKILNLRDYFAGQVLAGMGEYLMNNKDSIDEISETCYRIADSMIERRKNYD